jgi:hypothetical protein
MLICYDTNPHSDWITAEKWVCDRHNPENPRNQYW